MTSSIDGITHYFRTAELNTTFVTTFTYTVTGGIVYLEHVVILTTLIVNVGRRGDLRVELTSPSGTTSVLMDYRDFDNNPGGFFDWDFMSVHFWGENPAGQWTLVVRTLGSAVFIPFGYTARLYGTLVIPEVIQNIPNQCDAACDPTKGCARSGPQYCDACASLRDSHTLECVSSCPPLYVQRNGYCYDPSQEAPICPSLTGD